MLQFQIFSYRSKNGCQFKNGIIDSDVDCLAYYWHNGEYTHRKYGWWAKTGLAAKDAEMFPSRNFFLF